METLTAIAYWFIVLSFGVSIVGLVVNGLVVMKAGFELAGPRWFLRLWTIMPLQVVGCVAGFILGTTYFSNLQRAGCYGSYQPFGEAGIHLGLVLGTGLGWLYVILGMFTKRKRPGPPSNDPSPDA
jgi:hypothetical protein